MAFPRTQPPRGSFVRPLAGQAVDINPPGFCWWRAEDASQYRFVLKDGTGSVVYEADTGNLPNHVPTRTFEAGEYEWSVHALDSSGTRIDTWGPQPFTLVAESPEQPWIPAEELLQRVPSEHPRVIFQAEDLQQLRASTHTTRSQPMKALLRQADRCLELDIPDEPDYDQLEDPTVRRMSYTYAFRDFRKVIDGGMWPLALAYLFSGEKRYGEHALAILLEIAKWDPEAVSSIMAPYGDEIGLSYVKTEAHCYDWLYDLMDDTQRDTVRQMLIARGNQMLRRLQRRDFLASPGESHAGRLPGYLCEHAIAVAEEPEAQTWLDYALLALCTVFPHWGGPDGGWAEGIGYGTAYNQILLPPFEAVRAALGLDLWQRPFFRKVRRFFFYRTSPLGEAAPFGDGGSTGSPSRAASLLNHHAQLFGDSSVRWWGEQANPSARNSGSLVNLILPDEVKPKPPVDLESDAAFRGVGWAALHGSLSNPEQDTFVLFKSSPYGSVSHSHADQNCFAILKGGRVLASSSGYYGPSYGMPHHAKWTRQTKAHCGILVNGEGQIDRSADSKGRIVDFRTHKHIGYVCGDASMAYGDPLKRFVRHMVLIRPGIVCVVDELVASEPAHFQWLLHAFEPFQLDQASQAVTSNRDGAAMSVALHAEGGFGFSHTDQFDTPYNEGNPPQFHEERPNHYHFTASTAQAMERCRIVALALVMGDGETLAAERVGTAPGWLAWRVPTQGATVNISVQQVAGAESPAGIPSDAQLSATWSSADGEHENLCIQMNAEETAQ